MGGGRRLGSMSSIDWSQVKSCVAGVDGLDVTFEQGDGQLGAVRVPYEPKILTKPGRQTNAEQPQQHRFVSCSWWENNPMYTGTPQQLMSSYYQQVCQPGPSFIAKPSEIGVILTTGYTLADEKTPFVQKNCARLERLVGTHWAVVQNSCPS